MLSSLRLIGNVRNFMTINNRSVNQMLYFNIIEKQNNFFLQIIRPDSLNAVNLSMVQEIYRLFARAESTRSMTIIRGYGRSFCAGGDVKFMYGSHDPNYIDKFFRQEYILNSLISSYAIPYVALIDGLVMGGGVGLSIHGKYRVASENTVFAMPETEIGLFPDVGTALPLSRMSNKLGYYLATTGARLYGLDTVKAGIATHFCPQEKIPELQEELINLKSPNEESINEILATFDTKSKDYEFSLKSDLENIEKAFSADTMEQVMINIENDKSEWGVRTLEMLNRMCPTSLKVTFKELKLAENMNDIRDVLQMDYRIAVRLVKAYNFKEGVRARLIDRTYDAKWIPSTVKESSDDSVDYLFKPLPPEEELNFTN